MPGTLMSFPSLGRICTIKLLGPHLKTTGASGKIICLQPFIILFFTMIPWLVYLLCFLMKTALWKVLHCREGFRILHNEALRYSRNFDF